STLPCGARTFLPPPHDGRRPSGLLWRSVSIRPAESVPGVRVGAVTSPVEQERALERAHLLTVLVQGPGANAQDALGGPRPGVAGLEDLGLRIHGVAGTDRPWEAHVLPAEVGDDLAERLRGQGRDHAEQEGLADRGLDPERRAVVAVDVTRGQIERAGGVERVLVRPE